MSLKAGIVGLPNVGKSTLFNAITNSHVEAANYPFATINPNTGVVNVPDERLTFLTNLFNPKKSIQATFEFFDIAGLVRGASKGEGLGNQFLSHIRACDAIVEVVRCFDSNEIIHVDETVEKRIASIGNRARINKDKESVYEMSLLEQLKKVLESGESARCLSLKDEDKEYIEKNYHLLSLKPIIYVANVSDTDYMDLDNCAYLQIVKQIAEKENAQVIPVSCEIEYELSSLPKEERDEFLASLGASESGLDKVIKAAYKLLNLSTFFTVGPDECRAWTFKTGSSAPKCAGIIHTDFEKGFIKAEVYSYDDIKKYGSELALKEAGKLRMEGKSYIMQDGDIAFFRFNV